MVKNMTEGSIPRHLITYAIPLILGNLFQLTYNAVDSIIVGRFIGKEALAAVGTASPVMNIIILGISGICIGASVLMSNFFGAGQEEKVKQEMATTAVFGVYFSIVIVVLGIGLTKPLLRALYVPEEILGIASLYLKIIFLGAPFTFFYNAIASALKSVGDSKTPLKFLAFCSVLNGALDVIFIGGFHFGIICSAVTTVIAEALSAALCIIYVYRRIPLLQLKPQEFKVDRELLKQTLQYGSVTALQQSCQPVGKLLIQGAVNPMDRRLRLYAGTEYLPRHDHLCGPELRRREGGADPERVPGRHGAGVLLLGYDLHGSASFAGTPYEAFCHRGGSGYCGPGQWLSGDHGIFLCIPRVHQRDAGIFPGKKAHENDAAGNFYPDKPACDLCVHPGSENGAERRGLCLCYRVDHDAGS